MVYLLHIAGRTEIPEKINLCLTPQTATGDIYIHHHFLKASIHTIG